LLPTGTGVFLLIPQLLKAGLPEEGECPRLDLVQSFSVPIGAFGFVIALGLFFYELYGVRKCTYLIEVGRCLEHQLGISGQFTHRAPGIGGWINEPFAAGIIYPAVLAAWWFLALSADPQDAKYWAILVFGIFVAVSAVYIWWLKKDRNCLAQELRTKGCISAPIQGVGS